MQCPASQALAPDTGPRARMLAALGILLPCLGLGAWLSAPALEDPPPPAPCPRWLQVGHRGSPLHCAPAGTELRLLWAGLPAACLTRPGAGQATSGDRIVPSEGTRPACRRERMAPGILRTLGIPVALNRANEAELALLPGVGPALARRIREERDRCGPYDRARDLRRVRGIGPRLAARLRPHVTF